MFFFYVFFMYIFHLMLNTKCLCVIKPIIFVFEHLIVIRFDGFGWFMITFL